MIDLTSLSDTALQELGCAVDGVLCAVLKVSTVKESQKVEEAMRVTITNAWQGVAASTLTSGIETLRAGPYTQRRINTFLRQFGLKLKDPLTKQQAKFVERRIEQIYQISKRIGAREAKIKPKFKLPDRKAIRAIHGQQMFWVGDFYSDKLSRRIKAVSEDILLQQGLSHGEAAKTLEDALTKEFGMGRFPGKTNFAPEVPAKYAGNSKLYFEQVTSTASHQARTFGRLNAYIDADIKRFRLTNPNDERTGKICQQMVGQIVTVAAAGSQMNRIINAKTPKQVKAIAPWLSGDQIQSVLAGARRGSAAASRRLIDAGNAGNATLIPPFHGKCRTEMVPL